MNLRPMKPLTPPKTGPETFWNYEPCEAKIVRVIVGPSEMPTWWCAGLEGTEREAVKVWSADCPDQEPFYIDNEDGSGWRKVLGGGGPNMSHKSLPVEREIEEET